MTLQTAVQGNTQRGRDRMHFAGFAAIFDEIVANVFVHFCLTIVPNIYISKNSNFADITTETRYIITY